MVGLRAQAEPLAAIFAVAEQTGIVWLKFDSEAAVIDGPPVFDLSKPES